MRSQKDQIRLEESGERKKSAYKEEIAQLLVAVLQMAIEDYLRYPEDTTERESAERFLRSPDFDWLLSWIYDDEVDPQSIRDMLFSGKLTWQTYKKNRAVKKGE